MAKKTISSADTDTFEEEEPKNGSKKEKTPNDRTKKWNLKMDDELLMKLVAGCLVLSLLATILGIFVSVKVSKFDEIGSDLQLAVSRMGIVSGETQEDDVTISDLYTVRSTKKISDAYKNERDTGLDTKEKETLELATAALKEAIGKRTDPYTQEKAIYKWMTQNLELAENSEVNIPVSTSQIDEPYGVLKTGTGVPVGFATTFRLFMEMLDIPCKVVHDTAFTNAWNEVQLDDEWYHVDTCMDAVFGNYEHFNMNDAICSNDHVWDTDFFPAATGEEYCYAIRMAKEVKDIYKIPNQIKKNYDKKQKAVFLRFKTSSGKDLEVVDELVSRTADYLGGMLSENTDPDTVADNPGRGVADAYIIKLEDDYLLGVFFADGSQKEAGLTSKDYNKISKAVENAFPAVG